MSDFSVFYKIVASPANFVIFSSSAIEVIKLNVFVWLLVESFIV